MPSTSCREEPILMLEILEKPDIALRTPALAESAQTAGTVAVIGLGYVGLPLAVEFGKRRPTVGYDLSRRKVENLQRRVDTTGELSAAELEKAGFLRVTQDPAELARADFIIVAVPTPIKPAPPPHLPPLPSASATLGRRPQNGAIVIFESEGYPGATHAI